MLQPQSALRLAEIRAAVSNGEARRLRVAADLSIGEVARACGVDQSTVWRWEKGTRRPCGHGALQYAKLIAELRRQILATRQESA
ncbi:helix-turn-helix domain-containing protein [Streptomyces sp. NBC_01803]|uniref:helix-turn-helix domain-containing protein n=1 Tax=Streptomyces sp. NBC_01803 TaxID=2975946 RepID=UPI002DD9FC48|nr:helix-turn-helix transcriptional regulator [Streptomyces sp. NBC_01803]WSA45012.1 helix-turn-helix domain-containing protein [Streptomyces sp. NBC_01803]